MTCAMKREAWTWYLPSHLVPAKILCSRCEPCTNLKIEMENAMKPNFHLKCYVFQTPFTCELEY